VARHWGDRRSFKGNAWGEMNRRRAIIGAKRRLTRPGLPKLRVLGEDHSPRLPFLG
jgi:hypothetical protein